MGQQQFVFLLMINIFNINEAAALTVLMDYTDWREVALASAKIYMESGLSISLYIVIFGYMSIGALFTSMNRYMREEFQPRAKCLDYVLRRKFNYRSQHYRRKLIRMTRELNECLSIYNDIYRAAESFHYNFRLHIFFALLYGFSALTIIMYSVLYTQAVTEIFELQGWVYCVKIFLEELIVILSAYSAVQSGIAANKLSLDSVYMGGNKEWNRSVEIFINRINLYEFKPNIFGLFDVSSDILLMFISGSVTYLTYILQNTILSQQ
ncbi:putative gustatory receptor 93c [Anastrepha obliqua]|uniref:putative gustatory receptor 93c n=1 Tax=Anastrepha obliqua TaxID=95512 RepID=UPI002409FEB4|nr:putative gustatory receptor 93c [Anastrepha obliqua]